MDLGSRDLGTFPTRWQHDVGNLQQDPSFPGEGVSRPVTERFIA